MNIDIEMKLAANTNIMTDKNDTYGYLADSGDSCLSGALPQCGKEESRFVSGRIEILDLFFYVF